MLHLRRHCIRLTSAILPICAVLAGLSPARASEPPVDDPAWVAWVSPLLNDQERATFESLQHRYERDEFVERFWDARDPDPSSPRNELREQWGARLSIAEEQFGGVGSDRGTAFLLNGAPDFILSELCPEILKPLEIWVYGDPSPDGEIGSTLLFSGPSDDRLELLADDALRVESLLLATTPAGLSPGRRLSRECRRFREVVGALEKARGRAEALRGPDGGDWLDRFLREVRGSADTPLACDLHLEYPAASQGQTAVDGFLTLAPATPTQARTVTLDGTIFRADLRADQFRYSFEVPPTSAEEPAMISFRRQLAPGAYRVVLTARDLTHGRSTLIERDLLVASTDPSGHASGATNERPAVSLGIRPLPLGLLTGRQRIDVAADGDRISSVEFLLDGRPVMTKSRPPFSVEIDLGPRPRTHMLDAIARDARGEEIAHDSVPVNAGPHRFSVRLLEPRPGHAYRDNLLVHAQVEIPPGEKLDRVEFFFNETLITTAFQPPFIQPLVALPRPSGTGYVRAVATLDDGHSAEDLVVINTGGSVDWMQVDFVELYAGVVDRKGAPITDLAREDFKVLEDGREQSIRRFETVRDLPINAVVLLDTSESMSEEIDEARSGAVRFFESVLRPMDRAAVVVFSDQPEIKVPLTNDSRRLAAGIDDISAEGETTLYDGVVFSLYYLLGLRGKRALVLLTDGADSQSQYGFDDMVDFARSSGVAVYAIGVGLSSREIEAQRVLRILARETGGGSYFIDSASELSRIYSRIENELRSQYLIGYQSTQSESGDFRRLEISVDRKDLEVKSVPGYYP